LIEKLAGMALQLEPAEAARLCSEAARSYNHSLTLGPDRYAWPLCNEQVAALLQPVDGESAAQAARGLVFRMIADPDRSCIVEDAIHNDSGEGPKTLHGPGFEPIVLKRLLIDCTRLRGQRRNETLVWAFWVSYPGFERGVPASYRQADPEPGPCRLTTQDLVELLKMPTCVGEVRRIILDQLGHRYSRRFDTHWDFVRYAQEQGLNLDFTTPPQRPDRKLPPLFAE
jgi:hypothetical protein